MIQRKTLLTVAAEIGATEAICILVRSGDTVHADPVVVFHIRGDGVEDERASAAEDVFRNSAKRCARTSQDEIFEVANVGLRDGKRQFSLTALFEAPDEVTALSFICRAKDEAEASLKLAAVRVAIATSA